MGKDQEGRCRLETTALRLGDRRAAATEVGNERGNVSLTERVIAQQQWRIVDERVEEPGVRVKANQQFLQPGFAR